MSVSNQFSCHETVFSIHFRVLIDSALICVGININKPELLTRQMQVLVFPQLEKFVKQDKAFFPF